MQLAQAAGLTETDHAAIDKALALTGTAHMAERPVDQLSGGDGDDTYVVDSASDVITDTVGLDSIETSLASYTLGAGLERLSFTDTGVQLVTDKPVEGVPSITSAEGLKLCWG